MKKIQHKIKKYIRPYKLNIYLALFYRLFMAMLFMQQGRLVFYMFNQEFFPNTPLVSIVELMYGGLQFDLTAVLYVNALYIFSQLLPFRFTAGSIYQRVCKYIFIFTNSAAIISNMIDVVYYRFTLRRTTALVFNEFSNEQNYGMMIWEFFLDYWYMFIITGMVITGLVVTYRLVSVRPLLIRRNLFYYPVALVIMLAVIPLFIAGVRGGFAHSTRPVTISNATEYINNLGEEAIVLNTPFSIIRTLGTEALERKNDFSEEELAKIYNPIHLPLKDSTMQKKNVVVIIWESLGSEYVGAYNKERKEDNFTPFLDSLIGHSIYFTNSVANGKKSIDAMASVLASIPSLLRPFILTPYSHNSIP
ncbi:MAG: sulfatase-like hydrolase/transferase, partial [Rikenellaceae bacterium]